jgi:hypothetical protein
MCILDVSMVSVDRAVKEKFFGAGLHAVSAIKASTAKKYMGDDRVVTIAFHYPRRNEAVRALLPLTS